MIRALAAAMFMLLSSGLAVAMRPNHKIADAAPKVILEKLVPARFGDWRAEGDRSLGVVNPQQTELLNKIYAQILTRTYTNINGERVMLSIAYGSDQSDSMQLHRPEICYPAQGFQVSSMRRELLHVGQGEIPITRLETAMGQRAEPLTYWITVGDVAVTNSVDKKLKEMRYGLTGKIPDGLLFRVSSIDNDASHAFSIQDNFINQLLGAVGPEARKRLSGITN